MPLTGFAKIRADECYLQLFVRHCTSYPARHYLFSFLLLTSSSVFQSSSVPGGRNTNSQSSAIPGRQTVKKLSNYYKTNCTIYCPFNRNSFRGLAKTLFSLPGKNTIAQFGCKSFSWWPFLWHRLLCCSRVSSCWLLPAFFQSLKYFLFAESYNRAWWGSFLHLLFAILSIMCGGSSDRILELKHRGGKEGLAGEREVKVHRQQDGGVVGGIVGNQRWRNVVLGYQISREILQKL